MDDKKTEEIGLENPLLKRIHNFGFSALVAIVIVIAGLLIGGHFIFGFGIFMLVLIGFLTTLAIIEYVLALV